MRFLLLGCLLLAGCGGSLKGLARDHAERDLACEEVKLTENKDKDLSYTLSGCGKTARYRCGGCAFGPGECTRLE